MTKSIKKFHENVSQRITVCGLTQSEVSNICGITRQAWHQARVSKSPSIKTVRRISLLLAIPETILMEGDPEEVVRHPIPLWDYKGVLKASSDKLGMGPESDIIPPRWNKFIEEFGPEG